MKARLLINEIARKALEKPAGKTGKVYKIATFHRDHREYDDPSDERKATKLLKKLPNGHMFEFGNNVVDEYVIVVTDYPGLQNEVEESYLHDVGILEPDEGVWTTFTSPKDLEEKVKAAAGDGEDGDEDGEEDGDVNLDGI
jgi:hypothetical protein